MYFRHDVSTSLKQLGISVKLPMGSPYVASVTVTKGTSPRIQGSRFHYKPATIARTYANEQFIRRDKMFQVFTSSSIYEPVAGVGADLAPKMAINLDRAKEHRLRLHHDYKGMYPAEMIYGQRVIDPTQYIGTLDPNSPRKGELRILMEDIFGLSWNLIKMQIGNEYLSKMYATFLSSWGLLYTVARPSADDSNGDESNDFLLIEGYGRPYGKTYSGLASINNKGAKLEEMIQVNESVYILPLHKIPMPDINQLSIDPDFYMDYPEYYYASNGESFDVKHGFVMDEGLLQLSTLPMIPETVVPNALFDKRYIYVNDALYFQFNSNFLLPDADSDAEGIAVPLNVLTWTQDKWNVNIRYVINGDYVQAGDSANDGTATPINELVTTMEQQVQQIEADSSLAHSDEASSKLVPDIKLSETERLDPTSEENGGGESSSTKPTSPKKKKKKKKESKKEDEDSSMSAAQDEEKASDDWGSAKKDEDEDEDN
jgi:hypothetical protein